MVQLVEELRPKALKRLILISNFISRRNDPALEYELVFILLFLTALISASILEKWVSKDCLMYLTLQTYSESVKPSFLLYAN